MKRFFVLATMLTAVLCSGGRLSAAMRGAIIAETTAQRHGLARPWFAQIQLDRSRARVSSLLLSEGVLYVLTDRAMVHALDAETGATLWARQVGRPNHPSLAPAANHDFLAIVNGSRLYVCNRYNGDLLYEIQIDGAPGAGPALNERRAFIPMVNGLVIAYRLTPMTDPLLELGRRRENQTPEEIAQTEEDRRENLRINQEYVPPLSCQSMGRSLVQPVVTRENEGEEYVVWPTDRGHLNLGYINRNQEDRFWVKYRLETSQGIAARPTYRPADANNPADFGMVFAACRDGSVYAIDERSGQSVWQFTTGEPILQPAVVIEGELFVATQPGGMYCLDAATGRDKWWAPAIAQFVAASKDRVYAVDKLGRILVLNIQTGTRLDTIPTPLLPLKLNNDQTDRIYLATETGLIQCLHELEHIKPMQHGLARKTKKKPGEQPAAPQAPPGQQKPGAADDPFGQGGDPFGGGNAPDPVGGGAKPNPPGNGGGVEDNPFGDDNALN
ncbi:MAG: PQQ-binding-like beta-propeller repeat protein [Pirellulales bacterium]|nr:PQQ-binding-like beta-propeller repeat protein [Pirellulales bacterium]